MTNQLISELLGSLQTFGASNVVANPYAVPGCTANLDAYLRALCALPFSGYLLVGEAPGYKGCALTGIPFTSQRLLVEGTHPFLVSLRGSVSGMGSVAEATASIVWESLARIPIVPAFWNAFPFHPHKAGRPMSNRTPTHAEVTEGQVYLDLAIRILQPHSIIAVGRAAARALVPFVDADKLITVRHPSNGGKPGFINGLKTAGVIPK